MVNICSVRLQSCALCAGIDQVHQGVCTCCTCSLPALAGQLCRCGLPLPPAAGAATYCGRCLKRPPPFRRLLAPYTYTWPLDRLISAYKYRRRMELEAPLLGLWQWRFPDTVLPDVLVPVPMHWRRQWLRGFNQAARLARGLGRKLDIPTLPALVRARPTPAQQGLAAGPRRRNVRGAFACTAQVQGLRIALVDDVVTTGATAREAAAVLLAAGAAEVEVWALARALPRRERLAQLPAVRRFTH